MENILILMIKSIEKIKSVHCTYESYCNVRCSPNIC